MTKPPPLDLRFQNANPDANTLREIAEEIDRYNHMKSARKLEEIALRIEATEKTLQTIVADNLEYTDRLNLVFGIALGQLVKAGIEPDYAIAKYLKERYPHDGG